MNKKEVPYETQLDVAKTSLDLFAVLVVYMKAMLSVWNA